MTQGEDPKCFFKDKYKYVEDLIYGSNFHVRSTKLHPFKLLKAQFLLSAEFMHGGN